MTARTRLALDEWLERSAVFIDDDEVHDGLHLDKHFVTLRRQPGLELQVRRGTLLDEEMIEIAQFDLAAQEFIGSVIICSRDLQLLVATLRKLGRFLGRPTDPFWSR